MEFDAGQQRVWAQFSRLLEAFTAFKTWRKLTSPMPKGIYCYGGVGRGKTLLMDLFFEQLTRTDKMRMHFHGFMQHVHQQMFAHPHQKNPLQMIAKEFAKKAKILCLDEMMVDDVADAMILAQLLKALHKKGVVLIFTSNTAPEYLYKNGVQRQNFLPAIQLIQENTEVVFIGDGEDYRTKTLTESGVFFSPLTEKNADLILQEFNRLSHHVFEENKTLLVHGRKFLSKACATDMVWFSFEELCQKPRAYPDYLELAQQFKTIFVTDMPICAARDDAAVRRFIHLIDVLYDRKTILILSAQADVMDLYQGHSLQKEFERTQSRLIEMRTKAYWTSSQLPIRL